MASPSQKKTLRFKLSCLLALTLVHICCCQKERKIRYPRLFTNHFANLWSCPTNMEEKNWIVSMDNFMKDYIACFNMFQYVSYVACSSFVYFTDLHCICQKTTRPWPATEINRDQLALEVPFPPGSPSPWSRTVPFWIPASHSVGATMVSGKSYRTHPHLKLSSKIFSETKPLILKNLYTSSN